MLLVEIAQLVRIDVTVRDEAIADLARLVPYTLVADELVRVRQVLGGLLPDDAGVACGGDPRLGVDGCEAFGEAVQTRQLDDCGDAAVLEVERVTCLLYTSPSPRD